MNVTVCEPIPLREAALAAWSVQQAVEAEETARAQAIWRQEQIDQLAAAFKRVFGVDIVPDGPSIEIDGLTFSAEDGMLFVNRLLRCTHDGLCYVPDLIALGGILDGRGAGYCFDCEGEYRVAHEQ